MLDAMSHLLEATESREFKKPTYVQESEVYHRICIPNMIRGIHQAIEQGLKDPEDFYSMPGTWITFDFDNHPEMQLGIMTHTTSVLIETTIR